MVVVLAMAVTTVEFLTVKVFAADDVLNELIQKQADYAKHWNEGFIGARLQGLGGQMADVTAYWVGDRSRRVMNAFGIDCKQEPVLRDLSINNETYCQYSPQSLLARCGRRIGIPELRQKYRVLPTEAFQEIGYGGLTIDKWFKHEFDFRGGRYVFRTTDGYDVYIGKKDDVEK